MSKPRQSKFAAWFEEQFGPRPGKGDLHLLEKDAQELKATADAAFSLAQSVREWEKKRDQCLTAWNAGIRTANPGETP